MTKLAGRRESGGLVRGIIRAGVVLLMTRVAEDAFQRVVVVDVAVGADARRHHVRARQLEAGTGVIECAIRPPHRVVAGLAGRRKCHRDVIYR